MSISEIIKNSLISSSEEGDVIEFNKFLDIVLEDGYNTSKEEFRDLITILLVSGYENSDIIMAIKDFYDVSLVNTVLSFISFIFTLDYEEYVEEESVIPLIETIFNYLKSSLGREEVEEGEGDHIKILRQFIENDDPEIDIHINRLVETVGLISSNGESNFPRKILLDIGEDAYKTSESAFNAIFRLVVSVSPYAPIPKWVKNFVYNPKDFPIDENFTLSAKDMKNKSLVRAVEKRFPEWVISFEEQGFAYEDQDPNSIYACIEQQDTKLGFRIAEDDNFDQAENQLPFEEDIALPDYPNVYTADDLVSKIPIIWDSFWNGIQDGISETNKDVKVDMNPEEEYKYFERRIPCMPLTKQNFVFKSYLGAINNSDLLTDMSYFRIAGPKNAFTQIDEVVEGEEFSGERMFDFVTKENGKVSDWFKGYCQNCALKIKRIYHTVRIPVEGGGWYGCFCSGGCARYYSTFMKEDDKITPRLLQEIEEDLELIGIQDFIEVPEESEEEEESEEGEE